MYVEAFKIHSLRCLTDDVGLENQTTILNPGPDSALFDPARCTLTKTTGVAIQRADTGLLKSHCCVHFQHLVKIDECCRPQLFDQLPERHGFTLLDQEVS